MYDEFLRQQGIKETDLSEAEKQMLHNMVDDLKKGILTTEKWKVYVQSMRDAVSQQLEDEPEYKWVFIFKFENRNQIFLKARLRNYRIMLAILEGPEKAERAIKHALSNITLKK